MCDFIALFSRRLLAPCPRDYERRRSSRIVEGARTHLPLVGGSWYCFSLAQHMTLSPHPSLGQELSLGELNSRQVSSTSHSRKGKVYKIQCV